MGCTVSTWLSTRMPGSLRSGSQRTRSMSPKRSSILKRSSAAPVPSNQPAITSSTRLTPAVSLVGLSMRAMRSMSAEDGVAVDAAIEERGHAPTSPSRSQPQPARSQAPDRLHRRKFHASLCRITRDARGGDHGLGAIAVSGLRAQSSSPAAPAAQELKVGLVGRTVRHGPPLPQPVSQQLDPQPCVRAPDRAGREAAAHPRPGRELEADRRHGVGVQAAQGRDLARRLAVHGRRRDLHLRARAQRAQQPLELRRRRQGQDGQEDRRPHRPHLRGLGGAHAPQRALQPPDRVEEARRGRQDRGLQLRQGGDRHRPLQARQVHAGRSHRVRAQRRLLGRQAEVDEAARSGRSRPGRRGSPPCSPATST